jgi:hypothetical protein
LRDSIDLVRVEPIHASRVLGWMQHAAFEAANCCEASSQSPSDLRPRQHVDLEGVDLVRSTGFLLTT